MKIKHLLTLLLTMATLPALAQGSGIKGKVVSRGDRAAIEQVKITLTPGERQATSDAEGRFRFDDVASGDYTLTFEADDYEPLEIKVRVDKLTKDVRSIALVPVYTEAFDDSIFAEFDTETANDTQSLPSSLSSSKDVFNNIASYKFGEMRFNLRGYDSQYTNVYFNGIRLNDALTGYTPWSLWSGLNDATRNQENTTGLQAADYGLGGIGGTTNINATASQIRKGLPREPGQRQFDVPFPCDGLLRLRSARQRLVVCLLRIDATGRQRLGQRHLLQLLRLLRIGGETLQRTQPAGVHDPRRSDRARRAAGFDAGGLRPGRQQLLQSQLGLSGRQETQRPRAQQPRAADGRQLHQHARRPHEDRRSGLVPLRYERLLGPHVEGRCRPASRLLPQPTQLLHGQQPVLECGPDRRVVAYELRHPSDQLGPALRHQLPRRDRRRDLRRRTPLELHDRGAPHRPARPEPHGADRPHVPRQFAPRRRHPLPLEPHRILRQGERPAGRRLLGGHRQVRRARLRG